LIKPFDIAVKIAVLSAQLVAPRETFSTFTQLITAPSFSNNATPTGNLE